MKKLILTVMILNSTQYTGCQTAGPTGPKELDLSLQVKGQVGESKLGLKNGEVILQEESDAADELRIQEYVNANLFEKLSRDHYDLKQCIRALSLPTGHLGQVPSLDGLKTDPTRSEEFGLSKDGSLTVVKRGLYSERLVAARQFEVTIRKVAKEELFAAGQYYILML